MIDREQDERWMRRALELARATQGMASPNPQVGCAIVRASETAGEAVGEGAHIFEERDHAEIVALRQAGERARGATAYVTLEPCSHYGRTGPCAEALIVAGVKRVVVATVDPNPRVSGEGIRRLRDAGVEIALGVLERESRAVNNAFAKWIGTGAPLVTLKAAVSADGMIAPAQREKREPVWITGGEAREQVQRMRHAADAVLTGIETVLADDPLLTDRSGIVGPSGRLRRRLLLRVVLDSQLRIPLDSQLVRTANRDALVFCSAKAEASKAAALEAAGVEVVRVQGGEGHLDLGAVLRAIGERNILSVLLECGSRLNAAFLTAGLVDKAAIFRSNRTLGAGALPFAGGFGGPEKLENRMHDVVRTKFGDDLLIAGILRDPWQGVRRAEE